jgi:hypothetical protein
MAMDLLANKLRHVKGFRNPDLTDALEAKNHGPWRDLDDQIEDGDVIDNRSDNYREGGEIPEKYRFKRDRDLRIPNRAYARLV